MTLRVNLATSGRFHLLDLARELDALGVDVRFYSYVPRHRAESFGLRPQCHVALLPYLFPLVAVQRAAPWFLPRIMERLVCWALDAIVLLQMRKCDLLICMSGIFVRTPRMAKKKYGAHVHIHRSSRHILSQQEILANLTRAQQVSEFIVRRELQAYELADHIIVPSTHVMESFDPWPELRKKTFLNLLAADIMQFPTRAVALMPERPTVAFIGQWSYQKGVDILVEAIKQMPDVHLIHVGAIADAPFPRESQFTHHDHVQQGKLSEFYGSCHVLALPSRQDGFGLVMLQALCSGRQVVCSDRTAGPDLAKLPGLAELVSTVPAGDIQALRRALRQALDRAKRGLGPLSEEGRQMLSWGQYAKRELDFMKRCGAACGR